MNALYATALVALALSPSLPSAAHDLVAVPDWAAHGLAYGIQASLLFWARLPSSDPLRAAVTGIVGASAFGAVTECLQLVQPARTVEARDLAANTVGAVLVCGAVATITSLVARRRTWRPPC